MGQTTNYGLRYPENTDLVKETAAYIQNLAEDTETALTNQIIQENGTATTKNIYSASAINQKLTLDITTGAEFETGRIIDGQKEYGIFLNLGSGPNNETKGYDTGIPQNYYVLDFTAKLVRKDNRKAVINVPNAISNSSLTVQNIGLSMTTVDRSTWVLNCATGIDRSELDLMARIYYVKG